MVKVAMNNCIYIITASSEVSSLNLNYYFWLSPVMCMSIEKDPWLELDEIARRINGHPMVAGRVYSTWAIFRQL
jgi:hypothetical protein